MSVLVLFFFFFFKQKTAYEMRISDWSSDVCSSDLPDGEALLSELKAVDGAYPLYGTMRLESGARQGPPPSGAIWIGKDLASRLALKVGSQVKFGEKAFLKIGRAHV